MCRTASPTRASPGRIDRRTRGDGRTGVRASRFDLRRRASARCAGARRAGGFADSPAKDLGRQDGRHRAARATRAYFERQGVNAMPSFVGPTASLTFSPTLSSKSPNWLPLRANRLRIIDTLCGFNTRPIANKTALADSWKHQAREHRAAAEAAIEAQGRVGLMLNVKREEVPDAAACAGRDSSLSDEEWVAVNTIIEERRSATVSEVSKWRAGSSAEHPLNKIAPEGQVRRVG